MAGMRSRVHPKYKTQYRVRNWSTYDRALVKRGDLTIWFTPEAIGAWEPRSTGKRGAQRKYSDLAIETALTLRLAFNLPLRQTEGLLNSILSLMGLALTAPDDTTLSRRCRSLDIALRFRPPDEAIHLVVDSTGLRIVGQGEWAAAKHGGRGKRGWRKLHLGVENEGLIVALALTDNTTDDASVVPDLLGQVESDIARFTADAAYDTGASRRSRRLRKPLPQPGPREEPVSGHRASGDRESLRDLLVREPGEEAELDDLRVAREVLLEGRQRLVEREQIQRGRLFRGDQFDIGAVRNRSAALLAVPAACRIHQNLPHRPGGSAVEMGAVLPARLPGIAQPEPGLMHERGGL